MKKLDKDTIAARDEIAGRLRSRFSDLELAVEVFGTALAGPWAAVEAAIMEYNTALDEAWGNGLGPVIEQYNEVVADANGWQQEAAQSISDYYDERTEKWQEGDQGQRYAAWRDSFDEPVPTCDIERPDDLSIDQPDEIAVDVGDAAETLEQLPEEPEG